MTGAGQTLFDPTVLFSSATGPGIIIYAGLLWLVAASLRKCFLQALCPPCTTANYLTGITVTAFLSIFAVLIVQEIAIYCAGFLLSDSSMVLRTGVNVIFNGHGKSELFAIGMVVVLFVIGGGYAFSGMDVSLPTHVLAFTLSVGPVEEMSKAAAGVALCMFMFSYRPRLDRGTILMAFGIAGLGFGIGEAFHYYAQYKQEGDDLSAYLIRCFWCVPLHFSWTVIVGSRAAPKLSALLANEASKFRHYLGVLFVAAIPSIILHGLYDAFCTHGILLYWVVGLVSTVWAYVELKKTVDQGEWSSEAAVEKAGGRLANPRMNMMMEAVRSSFINLKVPLPVNQPLHFQGSDDEKKDTTPKPSHMQIGQCIKCKTVNPGDNRFCSECGALLYESCLACKVENRVGTKFCGKCGLDVARHKRIVCLRQQATELKQRAGQVPGQTVQLLTEARQKLQGILTESPTDETAQNELDQLDENLCAAYLKLASPTSGDEALAIYKRMLLVFPSHPEATAELARLDQALKSAIANVKALIEAGNFSEAVKQAVQADKSSGPSAELQALQHRAEMGASLLDQICTQRSGAALFACRKLLQTFPDNKAAHIRLQEIEQRLQKLKSSAGESIKAGDYKQAMLDLDMALADFGSESELQDIVAKGVTGCIAGGVETLLRELATLREQAKSGQARVMELSDKLIPGLMQERKYVAVLGCLNELIQLGAGAEFVTETRAKATEEAQAAQGFVERGEQLLAARKPRKAIKEFTKAMERCADNQRAIKGRERAENFINKSIVIGLIAIMLLAPFGVLLVWNWRDQSAWSEAQQTAKIAGEDLERSKQGYQKYLMAFPNGNQVPAAQQALAHIQEVEQARELAERERQSQIYYESGVSKQTKGDLAGALADYNRAIEQTPGVAKLYSQRGKLKQAQGDLAGALADYNQTITLKPDNADGYYNRGILAQVTGNMDSAIEDFTKAIELKPDFADAYIQRGMVRTGKKDLKGALTDYTRAIELNPGSTVSYNLRGVALKANGDLDGAAVDFGKAIELDPKFARAYANRAGIRKDKGDVAGAMADLDRAIELEIKDADAYCERGVLNFNNGNLAGALADYNKALEINPDFAVGYNNRGVLRETQGDLGGALADYNKAIGLIPDFARPYYHRGSVEQAKGNLVEAIRDFTKAIQLVPSDVESHIQRGVAYRSNNDPDRALADFNTVIEMKPDHANAYYQRAWVRETKGDWNAALADYDKAIEIKPGAAAAYYRRSGVKGALGELGEALADYNKAIGLNPKLANQDWLNALTTKIRQQKLAEEERQRQLAEQEKQRQRLAEEEKQRQLIQQENAKKAEKIKHLAEACFASAREADRNRAYSQQTGLMIYYGTEAIKSYTNFIKLASPGDERISEAQEAIAHIQGEIRMLRM
jgi:tetratricopeptide (TPR) repeat protein